MHASSACKPGSIVALRAACSGIGLSPPGGLMTAEADASAAGGDPYSPAATGGRADSGQISPFADPLTRAPGGREIIENPTTADIMMTGTLPEMSFGRADAPVTIIKYASLTCPHCRRFHLEVFPELKRTYIDTGKVRFIIREFPIGKTSGAATIALRCAKPEKYIELYGKYLTQQASWVSQEVRLDPIYAVAAQVGMTRAEFDACRENQGMIEGLKWIKERGRKLGVIGTPNFFVQGRLVKKVLDMTDIRGMVEPLLAGSAAATGR